jgi:hypothetical protein
MVRGRLTLSNLPQQEPLRWNVEKAGVEFGSASATLRKSLAKISELAGPDGCYSTKQIVGAIFGSMHIEKLATQKELRRKLELENAITTGSVLDRAALSTAFAAIADAITSRIMSSELSRDAKEDLLRDLSSIPVAIETVARRQTRLPRNGKGQMPEEDGSES